jgi:hypothetical protein
VIVDLPPASLVEWRVFRLDLCGGNAHGSPTLALFFDVALCLRAL